MFEFVQQKALYQIDTDVRTIPLNRPVIVAVGKDPKQWKDEKAIGAWDYWRETRSIKVEEADKQSPADASISIDGEVMRLKNIGSS